MAGIRAEARIQRESRIILEYNPGRVDDVDAWTRGCVDALARDGAEGATNGAIDADGGLLVDAECTRGFDGVVADGPVGQDDGPEHEEPGSGGAIDQGIEAPGAGWLDGGPATGIGDNAIGEGLDGGWAKVPQRRAALGAAGDREKRE
jgi:hypothetical protein